MLSESQQKKAWEGMISAEIRSNYFADLSYRYAREQKALTWITLLLSSGAAVSFLANGLPQPIQWMRAALTILAAALSLLSLVQQNQKRVVDASDLHFKWNKLATDYGLLWEDTYQDEAGSILNGLTERGAELSKASVAFPNKRNLMVKWQNYVEHQRGLQAVV